MWIQDHGGNWVLAFSYTDPQAGPSAKGAVVVDPIGAEVAASCRCRRAARGLPGFSSVW